MCGEMSRLKIPADHASRNPTPGAAAYEAMLDGDRHRAREIIDAESRRGLFRHYREYRGQIGLLDAISARLQRGAISDALIVDAMVDRIGERARNGDGPERPAKTLAWVIREIIETKLQGALPSEDVTGLHRAIDFIRGKAGDARQRLLTGRAAKILHARARPDGKETPRSELVELGETERAVELAGKRVIMRVFGLFPKRAGYSVTHVIVGLRAAYPAPGAPKKEGKK